MSKSGLWINNKPLGRNPAAFLSQLKYAAVSQTLWSDPAFTSNSLEDIIALADPFALEVIDAMISDNLLHSFETLDDLRENIALRSAVVSAMHAICSGQIDADYAEPPDGVPPTLGFLDTLQALWAPGADTGQSVLTAPAPVPASDAPWVHLPTLSPWTGFVFKLKSDVPLSAALASVYPFRGECAGALQLSVLLGALSALGPERLDALNHHYGPAYIGQWSLHDPDAQGHIQTLATRFLTQITPITPDYKRGDVIAVPGDYVYFSNKDDYPKHAPDGGWTGENCIYMGQDALGAPHYSGLGLGWKTEFALRMFLGNAYFHDCNLDHLAAMRAGKHPTMLPHILENPIAQTRFVVRAVLRTPQIEDQPPVTLPVPNLMPPALSDAQIYAKLLALGATETTPHRYTLLDRPLGALLDNLEIPQAALHQTGSSPLNSAALTVSLQNWALLIRPLDPNISHLQRGDAVTLQARFQPPPD